MRDNIAVLRAALRARRAEEQAFASGQALERGVVHFPREVEQRAVVRRRDEGGVKEVRFRKTVHRDGDVHAFDAVVGDTDRTAEVGRRAAGRVTGDGGQRLCDMLRAAGRVERE